jgi:hypothetical protein
MKKFLRIRRFAIIGLTASIVFASCTYNSKQALLSSNTCSSSGLTYSNFVSGYLTSNGCVGCHSGTQAPTLITYNDVKTAAMQPDFIGSIKHSANYSPMPKNQSKTDSCTIAKLDAWIAAGMPN